MVGSMTDFASLAKHENPVITTTHCLLHREVLISKSLGYDLKKVFYDAKKWSTLQKHKTVYLRMLKKLCENLDKQHINLLLQTEVRWLSRGRVLNRVCEQKYGLHIYFQDTNKQDLQSALKMNNGCSS